METARAIRMAQSIEEGSEAHRLAVKLCEMHGTTSNFAANTLGIPNWQYEVVEHLLDSALGRELDNLAWPE